jgi:hypothetical protein
MGQGAILMMLAGAMIAGATDLSFSLPGYIYVSICVVSTAAYLLLIRSLKDKTGVCFLMFPSPFREEARDGYRVHEGSNAASSERWR